MYLVTDFKKTTAITQFEHLPEGLQADFAFWVRKGMSSAAIQQQLQKHKYTATRNRIDEWSKGIPCIVASSVDELPDDVKVVVLEAYRDRKPKSEVKHFCASLGYKVSDQVVDRWFGELLRERQVQELGGELDASGISVSHEFEVRTLTWIFDKILNLLADADLHQLELKTVNDFQAMVNLVLRATSVSIQFRKMQLEEKGVLNRVRQELKTEVQRRLVGKPEVVSALFEAIDSATSKMETYHETTG